MCASCPLNALCCTHAMVHYEREGYWGISDSRREQIRKKVGMERLHRLYLWLQEKYQAGDELPMLHSNSIQKVFQSRRQRVGETQ